MTPEVVINYDDINDEQISINFVNVYLLNKYNNFNYIVLNYLNLSSKYISIFCINFLYVKITMYDLSRITA